jgi:hypothetical protein
MSYVPLFAMRSLHAVGIVRIVVTVLALLASSLPTSATAAGPIADLDGNGTSDVLWRDADGGRNVIWPSANAAAQIRLATVANPAWIVAAVGDFKRDPWSY